MDWCLSAAVSLGEPEQPVELGEQPTELGEQPTELGEQPAELVKWYLGIGDRDRRHDTI